MRSTSIAATAALAALTIGFTGCSSNTLAPVASLPATVHRSGVTHRQSSVGLWVSNLGDSWIVGLDATTHDFVSLLNVGQNGCMDPYGIKVDHSGNLWVACGFNSSMTNGLVQEYAQNTSTPAASYNDAGCNSPCTSYNATPQDVAFDTNGHIFASNIDSNECVPSCTNNLYPVVWWSTGAPNAPPNGIEDPNIIFSGGFLDVDSTGTVYTTGYGCIGTACGYLLDKISNPITSPMVTNLIPPSFAANLEGVYVSKNNVLNVVDGTSRTIARYHLSPWTGVPFRTLGPTMLNGSNHGQPVAGGFDQTDAHMALGDVWGFVDLGVVSSNNWSIHKGTNLQDLDIGAAYVPSDK